MLRSNLLPPGAASAIPGLISLRGSWPPVLCQDKHGPFSLISWLTGNRYLTSFTGLVMLLHGSSCLKYLGFVFCFQVNMERPSSFLQDSKCVCLPKESPFSSCQPGFVPVNSFNLDIFRNKRAPLFPDFRGCVYCCTCRLCQDIPSHPFFIPELIYR